MENGKVMHRTSCLFISLQELERSEETLEISTLNAYLVCCGLTLCVQAFCFVGVNVLRRSTTETVSHKKDGTKSCMIPCNALPLCALLC